MKNLTILVAAASFAAFLAPIARADATLDPRSETVKFADLDTSNVAGAAALYTRITYAAKNVCRDMEPTHALYLSRAYSDCLKVAIGNAVAAVDRPAVTAYAAAHGFSPSSGTIKIARTN